MHTLILAGLTAATLTACTPKAEHDMLAAKVEALEKRVADIESKKGGGAAAAGASAEDEAKAAELYSQLEAAMAKNDTATAKAKADEIMKTYGTTKVAQRVVRVKQELDVVGKQVTTPAVEKWYTGSEKDLNFAQGTTLVVFWEVWCPHCRREVPELKATADQYKGKMNVVGLTRITKSATEEKVVEFIKEQDVNYAMAKEKGDAAETFGVSGIPAAAIVKNGVVVWRGHPGKLTPELIDGILAS